MHRVVVHRRAAKYLSKLPADERARIRRTLAQLREDPTTLSGIKQMAGEWQGYRRVRVGGFRVIFWVDDEESILYVDHIGPRGDVYK